MRDIISKNSLGFIKSVKVCYLDSEMYEDIVDDEEFLREIYNSLKFVYNEIPKYKVQNRLISCYEISNFFLGHFISRTKFKKYLIDMKGNLKSNNYDCMPKTFKYANHYIALLKLTDSYQIFVDNTINNFDKNYISLIGLVSSNDELGYLLKKIYNFSELELIKYK
jgi:hypothetical protein